MAIQATYGQPGHYNVTPPTRSDGDPSGFEFDSKGNVITNLGVALALLLSGVETDTIGVSPFRRSDAFQASINFAANTAQTVQAATVAKSIYITDVVISSDGGAACNVLLQDNAGTPNVIMNKIYFPNTTATTVNLHFSVPKVVVAGNLLAALCSSATPNITVDVVGYVI